MFAFEKYITAIEYFRTRLTVLSMKCGFGQLWDWIKCSVSYSIAQVFLFYFDVSFVVFAYYSSEIKFVAAETVVEIACI